MNSLSRGARNLRETATPETRGRRSIASQALVCARQRAPQFPLRPYTTLHRLGARDHRGTRPLSEARPPAVSFANLFFAAEALRLQAIPIPTTPASIRSTSELPRQPASAERLARPARSDRR